MKKSIFLTMFVMMLSGVYAQSVKVLTIEDAVELAVQNNTSIKQSLLQLELLEKQKDYSWNSISPSISLSGGLSETLPTENTSDTSMSYSLGGSVNMKLSPSVATSIKSAKLSYEDGEASYESVKRSVELSVRKSFYSLLNEIETIASNEQSLEAAKRSYNSNLEKYNRGQLDELTLLTSQYNYERLIPSVESAKNQYQNSLDTFKQVLGIPLEDEIVLQGSLNDVLSVTLDENILNQDISEIPGLKTVERSIESSENSLLAARFSAYSPSLSLGYSYNGGGGINPKSDYSSRGHSISLSASIPLDGYLPWSNGALSIEKQKVNLEKLKMDYENTKTSSMIAIRNSYNSIVNAQSQLKTYEANLKLMQRTYEMTLVAFNNGSKDSNALQTAEDNYASARRSLQSQKFAILTSVLNLENTLGLPFGTLLNTEISEN